MIPWNQERNMRGKSGTRHIYSDLKDNRYNIRFFTCDATAGMPEGYIDGYEKVSTAVVSDHRKFIKNLYSL